MSIAQASEKKPLKKVLSSSCENEDTASASLSTISDALDYHISVEGYPENSPRIGLH